MGIFQEYMLQSTLHGAKYVMDEKYNRYERVFWVALIILSWIGSVFLIMSSIEAFKNNAISFVVESSYRDWSTQFPSVFICENKNMDRIQKAATELFGEDHDFTIEEMLSEIVYFRGESYHTVHECTGDDVVNESCLFGNYSYYTNFVRGTCKKALGECDFNGYKFDCCSQFIQIDTEIGRCYALNSGQTYKPKGFKPINMFSDKFTGPGHLKIKVLSECFLYTMGYYEIPNLITPKTDILQIDQFIRYTRILTTKYVENDPEARDISIKQRRCRFPEENYLEVHPFYSFSACSVQCRLDEQRKLCGCNSHIMPNTETKKHCDINGLVCLNEHYEDLSIVIAPWTKARKKKGLVCECIPSCEEVDILVTHESRTNIFNGGPTSYSTIDVILGYLPTERYKRNVVRGKLDLVVSVGGSTGLFIGASLLSFVEIIYYFTIRAGLFNYINVFKKKVNLSGVFSRLKLRRAPLSETEKSKQLEQQE